MRERLHTLIVDDSPEDREMYQRLIGSGQVDSIIDAGAESKILRLLDAKIVEENERNQLTLRRDMADNPCSRPSLQPSAQRDRRV